MPDPTRINLDTAKRKAKRIAEANMREGGARRLLRALDETDPKTGHIGLYVIPSVKAFAERGLSLEDIAKLLASGRLWEAKPAVSKQLEGHEGDMMMLTTEDMKFLAGAGIAVSEAVQAAAAEDTKSNLSEEYLELKRLTEEARRAQQFAELELVSALGTQPRPISIGWKGWVGAFILGNFVLGGLFATYLFVQNRSKKQHKEVVRYADFKHIEAQNAYEQLEQQLREAEPVQGERTANQREADARAEEARKKFGDLLNDRVRNFTVGKGQDPMEAMWNHLESELADARADILNSGLRRVVDLIWQALGEQKVLDKNENVIAETRQWGDTEQPRIEGPDPKKPWEGQWAYDEIAPYLTKFGNVEPFNLPQGLKDRIEESVHELYVKLQEFAGEEYGWKPPPGPTLALV